MFYIVFSINNQHKSNNLVSLLNTGGGGGEGVRIGIENVYHSILEAGLVLKYIKYIPFTLVFT
jgi:hypothetical protein